MAEWQITAAARTRKGRLNVENKDCFFLNGKTLPPESSGHGGRLVWEGGENFQLYAVCDGIGGDEAGSWASLEALRALSALRETYPAGITEGELLFALGRLTDRLYRLSEGQSSPMGVTLAMCLWLDGRVRIVNIGNSRVYRLRKGKLTQLSMDHTEVQQMVDLGIMTPYQAQVSPRRHVISQYVGLNSMDRAFQPYISPMLEARPKDSYLLCSDGLTDMVESEAIRHTLLRAKDAAQAVDMLVQQAFDNGGMDNATALYLKAAHSVWNP